MRVRARGGMHLPYRHRHRGLPPTLVIVFPCVIHSSEIHECLHDPKSRIGGHGCLA